MYVQPTALTRPSVPLIEGVSVMNATASNDDFAYFHDLDTDELIAIANREYAQDALGLTLANRLEQSEERNAEVTHELSALENDFEDYVQAHRELKKELGLYEEVLKALDIDPTKLWSERYRKALQLNLPSDSDGRQLELDFGGAR